MVCFENRYFKLKWESYHLFFLVVVFTGKRRQIVLRPRGSDEDVSMMTTGMSAHTHIQEGERQRTQQ